MTNYEDLKVRPMEVLSAYQHFLYYIDVAHIRETNIWGENLTNHFLDKLTGLIRRSGEDYISVGTVVSWVQEMTKLNQDMLLQYIMKFHSDKW